MNSMFPRSHARHLAGWLTLSLQAFLAPSTGASEVYANPPAASGTLHASAWVPPDGTDADMFAWDDFVLARTQVLTEIRWRGAYSFGAAGGRVSDFRISIFESGPTGYEPLIVVLPDDEDGEQVVLTFHTGNAAGEQPAGTINGIAAYDYRAELPVPITLNGGVRYWVRVLASQPSYPDWCVAPSNSGNGSYFRFSAGLNMFQSVPGNLAFSLHARWADLGAGLAGAAGEPRLAGAGSLVAGSSGALTTTNAPANSAGVLALGLARNDRPLFGGTLVPVPEVRVPLSSDAAGTALWNFTLPASLPAGTELYMQGWFQDATAPRGWSATNALSATTR